jgi:hypothetical protein
MGENVHDGRGSHPQVSGIVGEFVEINYSVDISLSHAVVAQNERVDGLSEIVLFQLIN